MYQLRKEKMQQNKTKENAIRNQLNSQLNDNPIELQSITDPNNSIIAFSLCI